MRCYYTGVGSRATPPDILTKLTYTASILERLGFILRSGHADGADRAFEDGVIYQQNKQIFLPWKGYKGSTSHFYGAREDAISSVNKYHPAPERLPPETNAPARLLLARNYYQIVGLPGDPVSSFVLCWTKDGKEVGGTGQTIRIAMDKGVPVFNFAIESDWGAFWDFLQSKEECIKL